MNRFLLFLSALFLSVACNMQAPNPKSPQTGPSGEEQLKQIETDTASWTTVKWIDSVQHFTDVKEGEKVTIIFNFENTGKKPLIIKDVTASCGCTVPEKPEEPIQPGGKGKIKAEFNSEGRPGLASKDLTVTCNTSTEKYTLHFEGKVIPKK